MPQVDKILVTDTFGTKVWVTQKQFDALNILESANAGGCAAVHGYIPSTGYVTRPVVDIQFISRFNYNRLCQRKLEALENVQFEDVDLSDPKLAALSEAKQRELFDTRKAMEIESLKKTLEGDRSDARRQGADRCNVQFGDGISAHLITERGDDGLMYPVKENGYPVVDSIMISHLELNRKYIQEGVRKVVNSGAPVLMGNAIKAVLNDRSVGFRKLALKEDNFESLSISNNTIVPEDIADLVNS